MSCFDITNGRTDICVTDSGGVKFIGLSNFDATTTFGTTASGLITSISPTASIFKIEAHTTEIQAATSTFERGAGGSVKNTHVSTFIIYGMDAVTQDYVTNLQGGRFRVWVFDMNGRVLLHGKDTGVIVTACEGGPGTALTDTYGYTITMTGFDREVPQVVDTTYATGLLSN